MGYSMKKSLKYAIVTILAIMVAIVVSCDSGGGTGGGVDSSPAVVNATKAFQIYSTNESYDTLKEAVASIKTKSMAKDAAPWTIRLTKNVTDDGATVSEISKGVVIDLQNYTFTLSSTGLGIVIDNGTNEVEITGGTITVPEGSNLTQDAVITSNSDLKISGTIVNISASVNAIESTAGKVTIGAKTTITTKDEKDAIVASNESEVKVTDSDVTITGGLKLSQKAEVDLGQAVFIPTKPIEKDPESTFKAVEENIRPKEGSGVDDSSIEEVLHNHTFSEEWESDENNHWHSATCGHDNLRSDYSTHVFVKETETITEGIVSTYEKCSVCGFVNLDSITLTIATPEFDLEEGVYGEGKVVRLSTFHEEVSIYYTTDGSNPTTSSTLYVNPIALDRNMTVKAIAFVVIEDMAISSDVVSRSYLVKVANPQFSLKDKSSVSDSSFLSLSSSTEDAQIKYTTDGSIPSLTNGNIYNTPISFTSSCIVKAIALKDGMESSDVVSAEYYHINDSSSDSLFSISNGAVSIKNEFLSALPTVLVVPEWINGTRATSIADYGFENCSNIQVLVLPDSITRIGAFAFKGCSSISSIDVGQYITEIASSAFSGWASSQTINDYSGVIKSGVLSGCEANINAIVKAGTQMVTGYGGMTNLYSITMPNSVRAIDHQAFSLCTNLSDVTMSGNITAIGNLAFNECTSISEITLPSILSEMSLSAFRHWTNSQRINDLSGYLYTFSLEESNARVYTVVPSGNSMIATEDIRYRSDIYGLDIPNTVYGIDSYAFQGTNIERITIPDNVLYLGLEVFKNWNDGQTVDFVYNNNHVSVNENRTSFSGTSAVFNVSFVNGITSISNDAFNGMAGLESISIPSTVTMIGDRVFKNTSINSVVIPINMVSLGNYCFYNCDNLTAIELPDSVICIGDYCFANCSKLATVNLGNGIASIPSHAFDNCSLLTNVVAPNCRGSFLVTVKVPVQQLVVTQIDIAVNPSYATSLSGYSTTIYRSSQVIEGDWRTFTYEIPDMLAIDYTVTISLRNADGEIVSSYSSDPNAITAGNQTLFTKEFYQSSFSSEPKVTNPVFDPVKGTYLDGQLLTLSCTGSESIFYTTDGSTPTEFNGTVYTSPLVLDRTTTIKAVGIKEGSRYSDVISNNYIIKVNAPVFSVEAGHIYQSYQTVELSSSTIGATIYYTLDGTDPTDQNTVYSEPLEITQNCTLKAIAYKEGLMHSIVTSGHYTIELPESVITIPTQYTINIMDYYSFQPVGELITGEIILFASFDPVIDDSLWTCSWSLDGENVSNMNAILVSDDLKVIVIDSGGIADGYHILQLTAVYDNKPYSKQIVFRYQQEAN